jgi:hypothetical protein
MHQYSIICSILKISTTFLILAISIPLSDSNLFVRRRINRIEIIFKILSDIRICFLTKHIAHMKIFYKFVL